MNWRAINLYVFTGAAFVAIVSKAVQWGQQDAGSPAVNFWILTTWILIAVTNAWTGWKR